MVRGLGVESKLTTIQVGVLGFGGLGQAAARVLNPKQEMIWVAAADAKGYVYDSSGLSLDIATTTYRNQKSLGYYPEIGCLSRDSISDLAAQSYAEVHEVKITFGVGIANWEAYRATIREDIAHLPGYDVERARQMTDVEVEALLDQTHGLLHLEDMEHADDIILELAGICPRDRVTVGGIVDTRNPQKPLSTNVQLTGSTFEGKISTHTFTLGDETSMAANVCGPAFGYLKAGIALHRQGHYGLFTPATVMPQFVR